VLTCPLVSSIEGHGYFLPVSAFLQQILPGSREIENCLNLSGQKNKHLQKVVPFSPAVS
jgi:hypothetical protein